MPNFPSTNRNGPWGGRSGAAKDISAAPRRLESITIVSGNAIDSLKFSYTSKDGQSHTYGPWGGKGGYEEETINLKDNESIIEVSGTTGTFDDKVVVQSLKFVTNLGRTYGPYGEQNGGNPFSSNGTVVGFHGSSRAYLDSIGTYTLIHQPQPTLNGPWGGQGGDLKRITKVPQRLESITIRSGWIIDSIEFTYKSEDGQRHNEGPWGGKGGDKQKEICLQPNEFITEVSGTTGKFYHHHVVRSLKFVTNLGRTHGPYGGHETDGSASFSSYGTVVGFHGRSGIYLDSIGTYTV